MLWGVEEGRLREVEGGPSLEVVELSLRLLGRPLPPLPLPPLPLPPPLLSLLLRGRLLPPPPECGVGVGRMALGPTLGVMRS